MTVEVDYTRIEKIYIFCSTKKKLTQMCLQSFATDAAVYVYQCSV